MSAELASVEEALEAHIPEPYLTEVVPASIIFEFIFILIFVFSSVFV